MGTALLTFVALIDQHNVGEFFLDWPISLTSRLFEIALVFVRFDQVASVIRAAPQKQRLTKPNRIPGCGTRNPYALSSHHGLARSTKVT